MSKVKKSQGKTTNRLVITFKDYSTQSYGTTREGFRCTSRKGADEIIAKRDKRRIYFADYFNEKGEKDRISLNTNKTILSI